MFKSFCLGLAMALVATLPAKALIPLPDRNGEYHRDENGNVTMGNQSFKDLQAVSTDGNFQANPEAVNYLGYDPSRSWSAGDRPEDVFKFGDLKTYGLGEYTLQQLNPDLDVTQIPLSDLRILKNQTLSDLVEAIPALRNTKIEEIPPLKDNLPKRFHERTLGRLLETDTRQQKDELELGARQEIEFLLAREVRRQSSYIEEGLQEGIVAVTNNVSSRYSIQQPDIKLDLKTIANATKISNKQILDRAALDLEQRIGNIVQNQNLDADALDRQIEREYARYQAEVEVIVTNSTKTFQADLESEVSRQLTEAGVTVNVVDLTSDFGNLKGAVTEFAREMIADVQSRAKNTVARELDKVKDLPRSLPTEIGEIKLGDYDLSQYKIEDLPGAESTPIKKYSQYEESAISDVPGASDLSFDKYPFMPQFGTGIARIDLVLSDADKYTDRTISGSLKSTFNLAHCRQATSIDRKGCAHVELIDELVPFNAGKQWVSGDSQEVKGGKNLLRGDGKEPTGRLPAYGSKAKMVLRNIDEATDTVEMFLAMQFCFVDMFGNEHCTPHDLVEIPVWKFKKGDLIFLGVTI